jgi:subtilisin family serine protease
MSLDFTHTPKPVEEAIHLAAGKMVLMFAAASNNGANGTIARSYRARDSSSVFGIYSTDFNGRSSTFDPPPAELDYNFSTLGENISSVWTGNAEFSLTGTSVSTPIAAATAALVLEFIR